eukprot:m.14429 g.14429  ORF g.14429 m.14429 type:complete len:981 (+) comp25748_c0_seq2:205-3147(+)
MNEINEVEKPRPKPRPRHRSVRRTDSDGSSSKGRRARPVPAPRKNLPKVRTRLLSRESSSTGSSRVSSPLVPASAADKGENVADGGNSGWEDVESDVDDGRKQIPKKSSSLRRKLPSFKKPKPPKKPPRQPGSFGRAAELTYANSSSPTLENDEMTPKENLYADVASTSEDEQDVRQYRKPSNPLARRPLPPPPKDQRPFSIASFESPRPRPKPRLCQVPKTFERKPRSISFASLDSERMYSEPVLHRSRSISQTSANSADSSPKLKQDALRNLKENLTLVEGEEEKSSFVPVKQRRKVPVPSKNRSVGVVSTRKKPAIPDKPRPPFLKVDPGDLRSALHHLKKVEKTKRSSLSRKLSVSLENLSHSPDLSVKSASLSRSKSFNLEMVEVMSGDENDAEKPEDADLACEPLYQVLDVNQSCPLCSAAAAERAATAGLDAIGSNMDMLFSFPCRHRRLAEGDRKEPASLSSFLVEKEKIVRKRSLWVEQPEVIESGVLDDIDEPERKFQEAQFELISSEATYWKSLNILINHFMNAPEFSDSLPEDVRVLDKHQRHVLFSNLPSVLNVVTRFSESLQVRWRKNCKVENVCDVALEYLKKDFDVYVKYCSNQAYQHRLLEKLLATDLKFSSIVRKLESDPICRSLTLGSYLLLPMQRITRFPLLIVAILERSDEDSEHIPTIQEALKSAKRLVKECNEGAKTMERTEQMIAISKLIQFPKIKAVPLISPKRWLLKRGSLTHCRVEKGFSRIKTSLHNVYLFVFTDLVLVTKYKKQLSSSEEWYNVIDYGQLPFVQVEDIADPLQVGSLSSESGQAERYALAATGQKNAFKLVLLENCKKKTAPFLLSAESQSDKTRWMHVIEASGQPGASADETVYGEFDCPYVKATFNYKAEQEDELSLEEGDIVKVLRKMVDGWYEGQRVADSECGWFPSTYVEEIDSEHSRARNLKKRYQLLSATESFLLPQKDKISVKKKSRLAEIFG